MTLEELLNILPPKIQKTYEYDRETRTYELTIQKFDECYTVSYRYDKPCPDKQYRGMNYIAQMALFYSSDKSLLDCLNTMYRILVNFKYLEED